MPVAITTIGEPSSIDGPAYNIRLVAFIGLPSQLCKFGVALFYCDATVREFEIDSSLGDLDSRSILGTRRIAAVIIRRPACNGVPHFAQFPACFNVIVLIMIFAPVKSLPS
jgi:hypothetical protein